MSINELTSSEEYIYGAHQTGQMNLMACDVMPLIPNPQFCQSIPSSLRIQTSLKFQNILSACKKTVLKNVIDEYIWLGTNPISEDSDRFNFDGVKHRRLFLSSGDGIMDGWEIHFGLDPLNRSNALIDLDNDGCDLTEMV